ncbi:hypothetical protein [Pontimicrobium sp. IMCC45349]|uniref:hypothetical protein n=1 Tax=Pontimicrobium sp. IMCC45349 TaxID=3391574 RepID=UPI0039A23851
MDFKTGITCGLINRKPDFKVKCNVIKLEDTFKQQITEANVTYETIQNTRTDVFGHVIIFSIITVLLFGGGVYLLKYLYDGGFIAKLPFIIMGVGLLTLGKAFGPFNTYTRDLKAAKYHKEKIDSISKIYGYTYDINIKHIKDSLGNLSHKVDLRLRRISNTRIS